MDKVRLAVVGTGIMGQAHLGHMKEVQGAEVTAVCDTDPETLKKVSEEYPEAKAYDNHRRLIADGAADGVLIATPHYFHPPIAIDCFKKGIHVLSEKPIAVHTKGAKKAVRFHKKHAANLVYTVMFMSRTYPVWTKAKSILDSGRLGEIRRVSWIITNWFRTQAYYDSSGWRATWGGEGGGVLLNQCPHNLDLLTWFTGLPRRVTADIAIGKYHGIEVEDEVSALLEYENGATGQFVTTTGEAPGTNRLEIVGDLGRMVVENGKIDLLTTASSVQVFCDTSRELFAAPGFEREEVEIAPRFGTGHKEIVQNFVNAILRGEDLIVKAEEAIQGLALGNAMLMSGLKKRPVEIPFDDDEYACMIEKMAARSVSRKATRKPMPSGNSGKAHHLNRTRGN